MARGRLSDADVYSSTGMDGGQSEGRQVQGDDEKHQRESDRRPRSGRNSKGRPRRAAGQHGPTDGDPEPARLDVAHRPGARRSHSWYVKS